MVRCSSCKMNRLNLTSPKCKHCQNTFCWSCRLPEIHKCDHKYKKITIEDVIGANLKKTNVGINGKYSGGGDSVC